MRVDDFQIPKSLHYTKEHAWVFEKDVNVARVGITDYAQKMLKEIMYLYLPKKGLKVRRSETIGAVESTKTISEIYSPLSGEIVENNEALISTPSIVNQDPYGKGWIFLIRPIELEKDLEYALKPEEYAKHIEEIVRVDRDLLIFRWKRKPSE